MPEGVEDHLAKITQSIRERHELYGPEPSKTFLSLLHGDMLQLQLRAINDLLLQGIKEFKSLSPRKLKAIQLALSIPSAKLPKTLELAKNKLEFNLSSLLSELPKHLH